MVFIFVWGSRGLSDSDKSEQSGRNSLPFFYLNICGVVVCT